MSKVFQSFLLAAVLGMLCMVPQISAAEDRVLVLEGTPAATVVIGNAAPDRARAAADELNSHLRLATGTALPVVDEADADDLPPDRTLVVIGGGELAASLGIPGRDLALEEFVIRTRGQYAVFVGSDTTGEADQDAADVSPATLWAVGHFLDRGMGVRWLWPGELGTVVPRHSTVTVPEHDVRQRPELVTRIFGTVLSYSAVKNARVTNAGVANRLIDEAATWRTRHQMGRRERIRAGHSFRDWWEAYHRQHPEIFATLPDGMSHPNPTPERVKLCVSKPLVAELILQQWREAGRPDVWPVAPNDGQGYCVCDMCRSLDVPSTLEADPLDIFWNRDKVVLTGRYLDLWRRLLDRMRPENPDVMLASLAYANYRRALPQMTPLGHENAFCVALVPDNWSRAERRLFSEWQRLGAKVIFRPNFWFVGYEAPYLPLHAEGAFMKYALESGIVGHSTGILGYWGTQGARYYLTARLRARPDLNVEEVLDEYASAFGEGAPAIRDYLSYWEEVSLNAGYPDWAGHFLEPGGFYERTLTDLGLETNPFWGSFYIMPFLYTDERLAEARQILDRAEALAGADNPRACRRIDFLRDGLHYLELTRDAVALANAEIRPKVTGAEAVREQQMRFKRLLVRLRNTRAELNARHVVWADVIAWHEQRRKVKMTERYGDGWWFATVPAEGWGEWSFRKDPTDQGVERRWYAPDAADGERWQPVEVPAMWHDTQVGSYQGVGWYRTTFRMPREWTHESVVFTFGAVDEQAWVYLNGELVGEHTLDSEKRHIDGVSIGDLWNVPFTINVPPEQLVLGGDNVLVVRVHNDVGAGGIWRPVSVAPPPEPFFVDTGELEEGHAWRPGESYTDFRMAKVGSGRAVITCEADTAGVIMEGGATGGGWALYLHQGELFFQCGKGSEFRGEEQAVICVPIEPGKHTVEWSVDTTRDKAVLRVDGRIAEWSGRPIYRHISGNDPGGIGGIHGGGICRNAAGWYRGPEADFTGTIHAVTVWPDKVCF